MKILLIFTFFLISGLVVCSDVIGYSRGSVIINCSYQLSKGNIKYFCKKSTNQCINLKPDQRQNSWDHKDRVSVGHIPGGIMVVYRNLSVEDAGLYRCGETGGWSQTVNLRVKTDPCCLGSKTVIGYPGETVTINCSYPEEFQTNTKTFYKLKHQTFTVVISTTDSQKGRFSISEDRRSRVVSVRISDVREDDGGVYSCAAGDGGNELGYYSLFSEIHLQVSGSYVITIIIIIIINVSICVVLLQIGGPTLICKLICSKKQGSNSSNMANMGCNNQVSHSESDYEEIRDIRPHLDTQATPLYSTLQPPTIPLNTVYVLAQRPSPSPSPGQGIYSMVQLQPTPEAQGYSTVTVSESKE